MDNSNQSVEIDILIYTLKKRYLMDFSHYKKASLERRITSFMEKNKFSSTSDLIMALLKDENIFSKLLKDISVPVTELFRDPLFFATFREQVLPILKTYPTLKIWVAGCATGEEAFSLAILLAEENLLDKSIIYATDINQEALDTAKKGLLNPIDFTQYEYNYLQAGGVHSLTNYVIKTDTQIALKENMMKHIYFDFHNITTGSYTSGLNLIFCRNVFIYFDKQLQNEITGFFMNSLRPGGFVGLGDKESLHHTDYFQYFTTISHDEKIFRKRYI